MKPAGIVTGFFTPSSSQTSMLASLSPWSFQIDVDDAVAFAVAERWRRVRTKQVLTFVWEGRKTWKNTYTWIHLERRRSYRGKGVVAWAVGFDQDEVQERGKVRWDVLRDCLSDAESKKGQYQYHMHSLKGGWVRYVRALLFYTAVLDRNQGTENVMQLHTSLH